MIEVTVQQQQILDAISRGYDTREKLRRHFKKNYPTSQISPLKRMGLVEVCGYEIKHVLTATLVADVKVQKLKLTGKPYKVIRKANQEKLMAQKAVVALQKIYHCLNSRIFWAETHTDSKSQTIAQFCGILKGMLTQKQRELQERNIW